ncbi:CRISPR-associated protein Cas2 [Hydrogenobacter thermophilus TK-6]|uniref:CRISPR-associated endoribonuclease Cas2 n=1 Tax=Hydrogenobacter thermophilus (strain DSM 6534 / IAM 12695 / TK-6) TaxID=608538 RepID=D3DIP6_HYDTT|nr:CRISPR-associated endonuclease Cas2 [Hydrogenobacter thermophilus]ADO45624.1 CRISPR-associated protein Cas2 [Hydrogenobacter thermophilus TK-6]BAI69698.1 CRISPR-associated protein [Hydrogenobacter thermophilus TK-6]
MFVILVYDVKEERVAKALKICRKYLTWVQNSVFEGEITEAKLRMLKDELKGIMDETYDSVIIYKFRTKQYYERETLGIEKPSHEDFIV